MNDQIADMIIRIKNAGEAGKETVTFPYSKMKFAIAELLAREGFVKSVAKKGKKIITSIEVALIYEDGEPRIKGVKRISKFSRRIYQKAKHLSKNSRKQGVVIITTPQGILTDKEAKKVNIGGEALFNIW